MKNICEALDDIINANLNQDGLKAYGLCQQAYKSNQIHPVTWDEQIQVAINDKYSIQYFHRILDDAATDENEDFQFGATYHRIHAHKMRTVVIIKKKVPTSWNAIDRFIDAIPKKLTVTGYKFINISDAIDKIVDSDGIYKAEFGDNEGEKRWLPYLIYALEWTGDYMTC